MVEIAEAVKIGIQMGPIANEPQFWRVVQLVEQAVQCGGRLRTGGEPLDKPGYFYPPTILSNVSEGMRIVDEEQIGQA